MADTLPVHLRGGNPGELFANPDSLNSDLHLFKKALKQFHVPEQVFQHGMAVAAALAKTHEDPAIRLKALKIIIEGQKLNQDAARLRLAQLDTGVAEGQQAELILLPSYAPLPTQIVPPVGKKRADGGDE